jgi:carbamate kinase
VHADLIVVALGGNALLRRGEPMNAELQEANVASAAEALSAIAREHRLVVTHGNGPQVGLLALQNDAYKEVAPFPLDVLDAESEGMIGYLLDRHLANNLPGRDGATLLTQVLVDADDPAMAAPTKPIGPVYDEEAARHLTAHRHWVLARDGAGWRRVVPSPAPREIVEIATIRLLVRHGVVVVCAGGGGIPVVRGNGGVRGIEAVIDKDATSALLARALDATQLLLLTDVHGIATGWGTGKERWLRSIAPDALRSMTFATGSMGPKVAAVCDFVERTGRRATVGALDDLQAILAGHAGTTVLPGVHTSYQPPRAA